VRARYITSSSPENDAVHEVVVVPLDQLMAAIEVAVSKGVERAEREGGASSGRLLDRAELAERLECSVSLVDKSRRGGMPCSYLGDSPRFDLGECRQWLRSQKRAEP